MSATHERQLWYTRREGHVRGPYPPRQISRYILLGRIREGDELRAEDGDWQPLAAFPQLFPPEMDDLESEEGRQRYLLARMREDERGSGERRGERAGGPVRERRGRGERRAPEEAPMVRHRRARARLLQAGAPGGRRRGGALAALAVTLVGVIVLAAYELSPGSASAPGPQCGAPPARGVNWNDCHRPGLRAAGVDLRAARMYSMDLTGAELRGARLEAADMAYATLNLADLRQADLTGARLVGAGLRKADLRGASLKDADLSYAVLQGARLKGARLAGARLDHAIWVDGRVCRPGSVGRCLAPAR